MNVIVDTSVWSLALRRPDGPVSPRVGQLTELIQRGQVVMVGPVRQELLSGIRQGAQFARLRDRLRAFPDVLTEIADVEEAARMSNTCRAAGVQGSAVDFLICAVAARRRLAILTDDRDFDRYAMHVSVALVGPPA